ncbi:MAG TPA: cyclase family protein [Gemmatimonadales bacterium]|nr:cyclase family protein [Gemmatimonadales bacterium]
MTRRFVELSHEIEDGMVTYPGLPAPVISDWLTRAASRARYAPGTEFHLGRIEMLANTGTYMDAPSHRFPDGADIAGYALEQVADLPGIVIRASGRAVAAAQFAGIDVRGQAVLVHTGWDVHWRSARYGRGNPYLTADAARHLVAAGAGLVGIDSLNIDDVDDGTRPAHTTLLAAGVPIVEHLCGLGGLPEAGFRFFAVPVRVRGLGSFPVRAFAIV